jgi:hypothetical protein
MDRILTGLGWDADVRLGCTSNETNFGPEGCHGHLCAAEMPVSKVWEAK